MERNKEISKRIKELRKLKGITQRQLANATNISYYSIVCYENGKREPNSKAMAALESYFHVTGEYLRGESFEFGGEEEIMNSIGKRIKYIRKNMDLTQNDFAKRLLVSQSYLSGLENGNELPTGKLIKLICLEFGVNESWINKGTGEMFRDESKERLETTGAKLWNELKETEFGGELENLIIAWDEVLEKRRQQRIFSEDSTLLRDLAWFQAQWEVYKLAMKQFYGMDCNFTRTDEYFGVCTDDEEFLFKIERGFCGNCACSEGIEGHSQMICWEDKKLHHAEEKHSCYIEDKDTHIFYSQNGE